MPYGPELLTKTQALQITFLTETVSNMIMIRGVKRCTELDNMTNEDIRDELQVYNLTTMERTSKGSQIEDCPNKYGNINQ